MRLHRTTCVTVNAEQDDLGIEAEESTCPGTVDLEHVARCRPRLGDEGEPLPQVKVTFTDDDCWILNESYESFSKAWMSYRSDADKIKRIRN